MLKVHATNLVQIEEDTCAIFNRQEDKGVAVPRKGMGCSEGRFTGTLLSSMYAVIALSTITTSFSESLVFLSLHARDHAFLY